MLVTKLFIKKSRTATGKHCINTRSHYHQIGGNVRGHFRNPEILWNNGGFLRLRCFVLIAGICLCWKMNLKAFEMSRIC